MVSQTAIAVRYPEADAMGIVHHAVYPVWYEIARMDFFAQTGIPYEELHRLGIDPPMVDLHIQYFASVSYPETVTVSVRCEAFGPKKLKLSYETKNSAGQVVSTAQTFHIWTGPDGRSIQLPQAVPEQYARFRALVGPELETL
jgi:acyl-CoA thioester hydrolase